MFNTDAIHPADVVGDTGEDGGLLVGVATQARHKAGHTVDDPLATNTAVEGATRVTLDVDKTSFTNLRVKIFITLQQRQTSETKLHKL